MEIKLKDEDKEIIFTDEYLDNDNFVEIYSKDELVGCLIIEDLLSAIQAFKEKQMMRLDRESKMKN
jgi:hypothetical protein